MSVCSKHNRNLDWAYFALKVADKIIAVKKSINHFFDVRSGLQAYEKGKGSHPQTDLDVKNHILDRDN